LLPHCQPPSPITTVKGGHPIPPPPPMPPPAAVTRHCHPTFIRLMQTGALVKVAGRTA
jgi:hypothetical protein